MPLWPYVRRRLPGFGAGAAALVLASAFQLATPLALRRAVDSLNGPSPGALLARYSALFLTLALLQAVFKFFSRQAFLGEGRHVEHDLRRDYFSRLLRLPAAQIENAKKGDLVSRAMTDLQDIRMFLGAGVMNFFQTVLLLAVAIVLLWRIHPGLTVLSLAPFPLLSWLVRRQFPRLHRRYLASNRAAGAMAGLAQEALSGVRILRAYHREAWAWERFEAASLAVRRAEAQVVRAWAVLFPAVGFLAGLGQVVLLAVGGHLVLTERLSLGSFVAFNAYLAMLLWPMVALGWTLGLVQRGGAALERLQEVLGAPGEPDGDERLPAEGGAAFAARSVRFSYDGAAPVLSGADLSLEEGSYCGVVGPTGSGKSTLVGLLARLRRAGSGEILVRGVPLERLASGELRRYLAVVPQDDFFFSDTLAANVLLGRPLDAERLAWALRVADLSDQVAGFHRGARTLVGEGGVTLSGGQRQRLSIARAVYGLPKALFLDAALSSLDAETARRVLAGVRRELPGVTLLVVSHRGSEVDEADRVHFLLGGAVAAEGRHSELLSRVPEYLRLYREEELRRELREAAT
ncbi:MAG: ABC transporter ATP-binding protein [Deltaproteobacteria bacterium]|nr:ABC transporter ATP-binding protein [Deltaproteobacteria bacterium]